ARGVRGIGGARAQLPLPGLAAVAVPVLADARLHRRGRTRRAAPQRRGTGGRALVHARRDRRRAARRDPRVGTAAVPAPVDLALAGRPLVPRLLTVGAASAAPARPDRHARTRTRTAPPFAPPPNRP